MIKYSYKDKELKIPVGIGNTTNENFEQGYELGYEEGFEVSYPSGYTDGFADGHVSGVTDGAAEQKAKLESATFSGSGVYTKEDGWNEVTVNVKNLVSGDVDMKSIHQTFEKNDLRPEGPNGEIVYGGDFEEFQNLILEEGGVFQIKKWNNEEHTDYSLQLIMHPNEWAIYTDQIVFRPWSDIPSEWTNLINDLYARNDGASVYFYWDYEFGAFFTDSRDNILPDEVMYLDLGYDGISAITVNAENIFASGYTSGSTDGYNSGWYDGHTSGVTDGIAEQKAKLSNTTFQSNGTFTRENGWNQVNVSVTGISSIKIDFSGATISEEDILGFKWDTGDILSGLTYYVETGDGKFSVSMYATEEEPLNQPSPDYVPSFYFYFNRNLPMGTKINGITYNCVRSNGQDVGGIRTSGGGTLFGDYFLIYM